MANARRYSPTLIVTLVCLVISLAGNGWLFRSLRAEQATVQVRDTALAALRAERDNQVRALEASSTELITKLAVLTDAYHSLEADYQEEAGRNRDFAKQIDDISETVGVLDKLSKTDKELLKKYSKVYFLNENYIPSKLATIPKSDVLADRSEQSFHAKALPFLEDMIDAAADDGIDLKVTSAYRSFGEQAILKGAYTQSYGSGANTFSADQGYSEHQLGTTVDLSDPATAGPYLAFKDTTAYAWLIKHAYRYGFILSYPDNNSYYVYEPWHWRFVGEDLADYLHDHNLNFYDADQRKIDEYLVSIFD